MYGPDEIFWSETIEGYGKKQFPKNYFHKSIAKMRGKALLFYICSELDKRDIREIYEDLNDEWIEQYRVNRFEKYLPLQGATQFDRIVDLFRMTYPELPEFDVRNQIVRWHEEILAGERKTYPYKCFDGKTGRDRAIHLLKYFKSRYGLHGDEITLDILQSHRIPLVHVLAPNLAELQALYERLPV